MLLRVLRLRRVRGVRVAAPPQVWAARQRLERIGVLSTTRALQTAPSSLVFVRSSTVQLHVRTMSAAVAANGNSALTQETLVQTLKSMCNGMRNDVRAAPPVHELVDSWATQVAAFKTQAAASAAADPNTNIDVSTLEREVRLGYESAIAIASKQRQFDLATALFAQMQTLAFVPTDTTYECMIRNVALELLAQPFATPVDALRLLVADDRTWERDLLAIIQSEEYAHHRKTPAERTRFHDALLHGVETHLDAYEATIDAPNRSARPYNKALAVYASNGVAFTRMLELMVTRGVTPDAETYAALLQAARWSEIPATLRQLMQSGLIERLTSDPSTTPMDEEAAALALERSRVVHALWTSAMKALLHSYHDRFFDRKTPVSPDDVLALQKVVRFADQQLTRAFPQFQFATAAHRDDVFALRVKAAAAAGLTTMVLNVLDEYTRRAKPDAALSPTPFLCAFELVPASQLAILHLPRDVVTDRALHRDVATSRRVSELERVYARLATKVVPDATAALDRMAADPATTDPKALAAQQQLVATHARSEQALARRLANARILKSYQLLVQEQFEQTDKAIDTIQQCLRRAEPAGTDANTTDLTVACKLLEQYMTCANRFEQRLRTRQQAVAPQLMRRVFKVLKHVTRVDSVAALDTEARGLLNDAFHFAIRTAVLLWRFDDANALVRKKKRALGLALLDPREYELLVFQSVADRNVRAACALVHEMHNAGVAPPAEAIHRIALAVLHKLRKYPDDANATVCADDVTDDESSAQSTTEIRTTHHVDGVSTTETETDTEADAELTAATTDMLASSDTHTIEDELALGDELAFDDDDADDVVGSASVAQLVLGADAPQTAADLVGFLQTWYNLHRIRPAAKTVVPLFAHLLAKRDVSESKRLLQILEAMDGGLTPATTLWLEKRLARIGKTIDDLRVVSTRP